MPEDGDRRRLIEPGDYRLLEDGFIRLLEGVLTEPGIIAPGYGRRPVLLVSSELDTGTEFSSDLPVRHPTRFYRPDLLVTGMLERGVPIPAGLPILGSGSIEFADPPAADGYQRWRDVLHRRTQLRRRIEIKSGFEGASEAGFITLYAGEYQRAAFPPDRVRIAFGDVWRRWLERTIPALGNRANFPNLPAAVQEFFVPLVFGLCRIPLTLSNTVTNDYAANRGPSNAVIAVYRQLPGEQPPAHLVPAGEYMVIQAPQTIDGVDYTLTLIRFAAAQQESAILYADIDGINFRGSFGAMPAVTGTIRNIVDHAINLLFYMVRLEPAALPFDTESFAAAWQKYEDVVIEDASPVEDNRLAFDGAIVEPMTFGAALALLQTSSQLQIFQNRFGQIAAALIYGETPERIVFSETTDILGAGGAGVSPGAIDITPAQPEKTFNRFRYRYGKDFVDGQYAATEVYDNAPDQEETGEIEEEEIELPFVRSAATAAWVIALRARYFSLRSYHVELSLDGPRYGNLIELARAFGVTYYGGIGAPWIDKEFYCYAITYLWDQLRYVIRGVSLFASGTMLRSTGGLPAELLDLGIGSSSGGPVAYTRSRWRFNRADYPPAATFSFELIYYNGRGDGLDGTVEILNEAGDLIQTIPLPLAGTSVAPVRVSHMATWTAPTGTYYFRVQTVPSNNVVVVYSIRLIADIPRGDFALFDIPLTSAEGASSTNLTIGTGDLFRTTSGSYTAIENSMQDANLGQWTFHQDEWKQLSGVRFSGVIGHIAFDDNTGGGAALALFDVTTGSMVSGSELTAVVPDVLSLTAAYRDVTLPPSALIDGHTYEPRLRAVAGTGGIGGNAFLYKCRLQLAVNPLERALIYWRAAKGSSAGRWEARTHFLAETDQAFMEISGYGAGQISHMQDAGLNDGSVVTGTNIPESALTYASGTKAVLRSPALPLITDHRYLIDGNGTTAMGFLVIPIPLPEG